MIEFTCPGCGKSFHVDEGLTGRRSRCKQCGNVTRIPAADLPVALGPRLHAVAAPKVAVRRRTRVRKPRAIDRDAWISIAIGSGLAAVALAVPLVGFVPDVLKTAVIGFPQLTCANLSRAGPGCGAISGRGWASSRGAFRFGGRRSHGHR
jgi:uncharacterized protein (DUF983 family)